MYTRINPDDASAHDIFCNRDNPDSSNNYQTWKHKIKNAVLNSRTISGSFVAGVFDGPYNSIPKYIKEMENYLKEKDQIARDYYVHYAYCPACAKENGHNYMILFALV